ncbi:hypothetical protein GCM10007860_00020 [Chitiniphilus shinanonensis]|uniref:Porin n=1 Tax=Chitiniphilus shinanonensis TaxID=553088 RepID=A0ABQ6BSR6_9NEIS|nr:hypothetical protein [Chitiniphilus shinanonensis]GLS02859.1 hypothetical protein GCM10007860_00020 [Chitiniphilus shinanonensis]
MRRLQHVHAPRTTACPAVAGGRACAALLAMVLGLACTAPAWADDAPWLPDSVETPAPAPVTDGQGKLFLELAANRLLMHDPQPDTWHGNLGLDGYGVRPLPGDGRGTLNARIDVASAPGAGLDADNLSLTLRELYLSRSGDDWGVGVGRINIRDGVAVGFNPSDVFRDGALLARRTADPAVLRESRLGVVGVRAQHSFAGGTLAGMLVPHLDNDPPEHWYDPRWGAVNDGQAQAYLMYALPRWQGLYSNLVLHTLEHGDVTWGFNLTNNLGRAVVAYLEFASTRRPTLVDLARDADAAPRRYQQLAAGFSYSTESNQTFTLEYDYNGGGLGRDDWRGDWRTFSPTQAARALTAAGARQDPLAEHSAMAMLQWDRFLAHDADLNCLLRASLVDDSRFAWCEWRNRWPRTELALSATWADGDADSEYGASGQSWMLGAKARVYF